MIQFPTENFQSPLDRQIAKLRLKQFFDEPHRGGCKAPLVVQLKERHLTVVPCGKCLPCLRKYRNVVIGRTLAESTCWANAQALTLTYDDDHLPANEEINTEFLKNVFKAFLRRVNYKYGKSRHFAVAQISPNGRLHFHVNIMTEYPMPLPTAYRHTILPDKLWKFGHREVKELDHGSVAYAAEYLTRKGSKGTIRNFKSTLLGEGYFRRWCQAKEGDRYPTKMVGSYSIPDARGGMRWYPMDRRFREIADEYGYDFRSPEPLTYREWLADQGPTAANIGWRVNQGNEAKLSRIPEKQPEHFLASEIRGRAKWL